MQLMFPFLLIVSVCMLAGGPVRSSRVQGVKQSSFAASSKVEPRARLEVRDFRCIIVGDSQTTTPDSDRIRAQMHGWDAPIIGELLTVGNGAAGMVVLPGTQGNLDIVYRDVDPEMGWGDGGPNDFFGMNGSEWSFQDDIEMPFSPISRYLVRFGGLNFRAPWDEDWGMGQNMVARIAVRTTPDTIGSIAVRSERGGVVSMETIHALNQDWGIQILEQPIPVSISEDGDNIGVGLYLPRDQVEEAGEELQVIGVLLERVGPRFERLDGMIMGFQGRGGWNAGDHVSKISQGSRRALISMLDADKVMVMLGHNREDGGIGQIGSNYTKVVYLWESAFLTSGRDRPQFVYVVPWPIIEMRVAPYLLVVDQTMRRLSAPHRSDLVVSYVNWFGGLRPDIFDSSQYRLDFGRIHPGNDASSRQLAEDLYDMLFEGKERP